MASSVFLTALKFESTRDCYRNAIALKLLCDPCSEIMQ